MSRKRIVTISCIAAAVALIAAWMVACEISWARFKEKYGSDDEDDEDDEFFEDDIW